MYGPVAAAVPEGADGLRSSGGPPAGVASWGAGCNNKGAVREEGGFGAWIFLKRRVGCARSRGWGPGSRLRGGYQVGISVAPVHMAWEKLHVSEISQLQSLRQARMERSARFHWVCNNMIRRSSAAERVTVNH